MGAARQFAQLFMSAAGQLAVEHETEGWNRLTVALKDIGLHDEIVDAMQITLARSYATNTREMAERALALTQLVISARPKEQVLSFLRRASRCYVLGLAAESIILCRSALETALSEAFDKRGISTPGRLIDRLRHGVDLGMFDQQAYRDGETIRVRGNTTVHNSSEVPKDALGTLQLTMSVLGALYSK